MFTKSFCAFAHCSLFFSSHRRMCIDQFVYFFVQIDSVLRNDSNRVIQPEVIYRSDTLGQASSNTIAGSSNNAIDRKGSVAIGQSVFYTDYPPQDYGSSGKYYFECNLFNLIFFSFLFIPL